MDGGQTDIEGNEGISIGQNLTVTVFGNNTVFNVTGKTGAAIIATNVELKGGKIKAISSNNGAACISISNSIKIDNADVYAETKGEGDMALYSRDGSITVSGDDTIITVAKGKVCAKTGITIPEGFLNSNIAAVDDGYHYVVDEDSNILNAVTIYKPKYTVTMSDDGNGSASASPTSGAQGTSVTIEATTDSDHLFDHWEVVSGGVTLADANSRTTTFDIGSSNVEIKAFF